MTKDAKISIPESVSAVLNMRSYDYWKKISEGSVSNFIAVWENYSDDDLFKQDLLLVLLNFRRIINAHFQRNN